MDANKMIEIIEAAGYEPRSYSGSSMYGKTCVALDIERFGEIKATCAILQVAHDWDSDDENELFNDVAETLERAKTDDMGRGEIMYFPRLEWPGDTSSDED